LALKVTLTFLRNDQITPPHFLENLKFGSFLIVPEKKKIYILGLSRGSH